MSGTNILVGMMKNIGQHIRKDIFAGMLRFGDKGISYNSVMPISLKEVEHIAALARLELTDIEKNRYTQQLSAILDHVTKMQLLDTSAIQPTAGVLVTEKPLRVDQSRSGLSPEVLLSTSAKKDRSQYKIPPVFEQD